jgi:peptidoglycan/LPS O-acetylase OafA/YrhL
MLALALTANPERSFVGRALTQRWLVYTGRISYGVYLIHVPIFLAVNIESQRIWGSTQVSAPKQALIVCFAFAAVFVVAAISWFCFEQPILRLKEYFRSEKPAPDGAAAK